MGRLFDLAIMRNSMIAVVEICDSRSQNLPARLCLASKNFGKSFFMSKRMLVILRRADYGNPFISLEKCNWEGRVGYGGSERFWLGVVVYMTVRGM